MRQIQISPQKLAEKPDCLGSQGAACVPCAFSVVLNQPYEKVNAWLRARDYRRTPRGGTYTNSIDMTEIGLQWTVGIGFGMTVNKFAQLNLIDTFLIQVSGHVLAYKGGIIYDTIDSSKRKIKKIWKQVEQNKLPPDFGTVVADNKTIKPRQVTARGEKRNHVLHLIEQFTAQHKTFSIRDLQIEAKVSYIYARWCYLQHIGKTSLRN